MKRLLVLFALLSACPCLPGHPAILSSEIINENPPYPECHASTIVETRDGRLVAAWFGGTKERNPDVGIWVARHDGKSWLPAVEVANGLQADGSARQPTWNPVLFQAPGGPLVLFYKVGPSPSKWWGMKIESIDGGLTWSTPARLPEGILGPIKNKPAVLGDGTWVSVSSTEGNKEGWLLHLETSKDAGKTWTRSPAVPQGPKFDAIQGSLLFHPEGKLQIVARSKQGVVVQTWSKDQGATWSALTATDLPNPNSGTDAVSLSDGRQLIIYNHSGHRAEQAKGDRWPLNLGVSKNGLQWTNAVTLESEPNKSGYAYPAVIQARDGKVHITYTVDRRRIKHVVVDPSRL